MRMGKPEEPGILRTSVAALTLVANTPRSRSRLRASVALMVQHSKLRSRMSDEPDARRKLIAMSRRGRKVGRRRMTNHVPLGRSKSDESRIVVAMVDVQQG